MKTFANLEFEPHNLRVSEETKQRLIVQSTDKDFIVPLPNYHATITFDNERKLAVILGERFHSNGIDTYEVMEQTPGSDVEPVGWLTHEEVTAYMLEMQS